MLKISRFSRKIPKSEEKNLGFREENRKISIFAPILLTKSLSKNRDFSNVFPKSEIFFLKFRNFSRKSRIFQHFLMLFFAKLFRIKSYLKRRNIRHSSKREEPTKSALFLEIPGFGPHGKARIVTVLTCPVS